LQQKYWEETSGFPKKAFSKLEGRTKALGKNLFHTKLIIVADKENNQEITDNTTLYFGSHNFSGGAWGNQEKDGS
jgi:tyrosyl-DNA phosphodiesterase-1